MAYAFSDVVAYGKYRPKSKLWQWDESVLAYFDALSDDEKARLGMLRGELIYKASMKFSHDLGPLKAYEQPPELRFRTERKRLTSFFIARDGLFIVDDAFKSAVEKI